eukprot:120020_1
MSSRNQRGKLDEPSTLRSIDYTQSQTDIDASHPQSSNTVSSHNRRDKHAQMNVTQGDNTESDDIVKVLASIKSISQQLLKGKPNVRALQLSVDIFRDILSNKNASRSDVVLSAICDAIKDMTRTQEGVDVIKQNPQLLQSICRGLFKPYNGYTRCIATYYAILSDPQHQLLNDTQFVSSLVANGLIEGTKQHLRYNKRNPQDVIVSMDFITHLLTKQPQFTQDIVDSCAEDIVESIETHHTDPNVLHSVYQAVHASIRNDPNTLSSLKKHGLAQILNDKHVQMNPETNNVLSLLSDPADDIMKTVYSPNNTEQMKDLERKLLSDSIYDDLYASLMNDPSIIVSLRKNGLEDALQTLHSDRARTLRSIFKEYHKKQKILNSIHSIARQLGDKPSDRALQLSIGIFEQIASSEAQSELIINAICKTLQNILKNKPSATDVIKRQTQLFPLITNKVFKSHAEHTVFIPNYYDILTRSPFLNDPEFVALLIKNGLIQGIKNHLQDNSNSPAQAILSMNFISDLVSKQPQLGKTINAVCGSIVLSAMKLHEHQSQMKRVLSSHVIQTILHQREGGKEGHYIPPPAYLDSNQTKSEAIPPSTVDDNRSPRKDTDASHPVGGSANDMATNQFDAPSPRGAIQSTDDIVPAIGTSDGRPPSSNGNNEPLRIGMNPSHNHATTDTPQPPDNTKEINNRGKTGLQSMTRHAHDGASRPRWLDKDSSMDATTHTVQHTSRMNTTRNQNDVDASPNVNDIKTMKQPAQNGRSQVTNQTQQPNGEINERTHTATNDSSSNARDYIYPHANANRIDATVDDNAARIRSDYAPSRGDTGTAHTVYVSANAMTNKSKRTIEESDDSAIHQVMKRSTSSNDEPRNAASNNNDEPQRIDMNRSPHAHKAVSQSRGDDEQKYNDLPYSTAPSENNESHRIETDLSSRATIRIYHLASDHGTIRNDPNTVSTFKPHGTPQVLSDKPVQMNRETNNVLSLFGGQCDPIDDIMPRTKGDGDVSQAHVVSDNKRLQSNPPRDNITLKKDDIDGGNASPHAKTAVGRSRGDERHSTESQRTQASPNVPQHRFMEHKSSKGGKDPLLRDIVDEPLTHAASDRQSTRNIDASYPATKYGCVTCGELYPLPHGAYSWRCRTCGHLNQVNEASAAQPPNNNDAYVRIGPDRDTKAAKQETSRKQQNDASPNVNGSRGNPYDIKTMKQLTNSNESPRNIDAVDNDSSVATSVNRDERPSNDAVVMVRRSTGDPSHNHAATDTTHPRDNHEETINRDTTGLQSIEATVTRHGHDGASRPRRLDKDSTMDDTPQTVQHTSTRTNAITNPNDASPNNRSQVTNQTQPNEELDERTHGNHIDATMDNNAGRTRSDYAPSTRDIDAAPTVHTIEESDNRAINQVMKRPPSSNDEPRNAASNNNDEPQRIDMNRSPHAHKAVSQSRGDDEQKYNDLPYSTAP